jgi:UDP-glucose 4-epimerase
MSDRQVVVVTGVAGYWGARVATRLLEEPELHVIGVDSQPPQEAITGLDFVQANVHNRLLVDLLASEHVHTICHLAFVESAEPDEEAFEFNVMGTMKVLAAAAKAGVHKIVLKSSTMVYGAHATNSAFLTEAHALKGSRTTGAIRDLIEIETFCQSFRRQSPHVNLTVLRFANIVGLTADTPMTRFLKNREAPVLLGFDPMMQIIHEDDAVNALAHAVLNDAPGVFNVTAEGPLHLSRLMALAGKLAVPMLHIVAYWGAGVGGGRFMPIELDYLRYRWVADLKKMREEFGFTPQYSPADTLREFAKEQRMKRYLGSPDALDLDEERLRAILAERQRTREAGEGMLFEEIIAEDAPLDGKATDFLLSLDSLGEEGSENA